MSRSQKTMKMNVKYIKNKKQSLIKNLIFSKIKLLIERIEFKYHTQRNKIVLNRIKHVKNDDWVHDLNQKYFKTFFDLEREYLGTRTIFCKIDEDTYKKYNKLCDEYDRECNEELKKINKFVRMIFNIKPNINDRIIFGKYGQSVNNIIVKGLFKPEFKFVVLGNYYRLEREKNEDGYDTVTIKVTDKKSKDKVVSIL